MIWLRWTALGKGQNSPSVWDIYNNAVMQSKQEAMDAVSGYDIEETDDPKNHIANMYGGWVIPIGKINKAVVMSGFQYRPDDLDRTFADLEECETLAESAEYLEVWIGRTVEYNEFNIHMVNDYEMKMNFVPQRFIGSIPKDKFTMRELHRLINAQRNQDLMLKLLAARS